MKPDHSATFNHAISALRLFAVLLIVLAHFWVKNPFWMTLGVSFCFFYSGYVTAMRHPFNPYRRGEHGRFLLSRVAKLYPLHLLTVVTCGLLLVHMGNIHRLGARVMLSHMSLLQSFIPNEIYYFGYNPVTWFVSDIMFLYLMAPLVLAVLRRLRVRWQVMLVGLLVVLQLLAGASKWITDPYYIYEFPPMRLLDFAAGAVLLNCTRTCQWQRLRERIARTDAGRHVAEVAGVLLFAAFYWLGVEVIDKLCYRGFCTSVLAVVTLIGAMVLTQGHEGWLATALGCRPLRWLAGLSMEIFLLQHTCYWSVEWLMGSILPAHMAYDQWPWWLAFVVQMIVLIVVAWVVKRCFVTPLARLIYRPQK